MIPSPWNTPDAESDDPSAPGRPLPTLVSLHFLRTALQRRWMVCVLGAALGLFLAAAFLVAAPPPHKAKAVLVVAHDPQVAAERAISTDVSLLTTRTVAAQTIASLGLTISPDDLVESITAKPVSQDLIAVTLTAPTDIEAVRRLEALTSTYLTFRAEQLTQQSNVVVDGMKQRIAELQEQVGELTQRIDQLSAADSSEEGELGDAIAQRAQVTSQIETLQESVQDATLQNNSIVAASQVIDAAAVEPQAGTRRTVVTLASGLIAGAALGCGAVLFLAITSDRLRRRFDVATALGVPVLVSVGRITPLRRWWRWIPWLSARNARRADERRRLARVIEMALPLPARWGRLAVACVDNADEARFAVAHAALDLASRLSLASALGTSSSPGGVLLVDLTNHGGLDAAVARLTHSETAHRPSVLRPRGVPALARDLADFRVVGVEDEDADPRSPDLMDVTLVLADLDPSVGADHLKAWTDRVVVVVTSGNSSAERIRTAAELVRAAGLPLRFGALLRTDGTDESSGEAGLDRPGSVQGQEGNAAMEPTTSPGGSPPSEPPRQSSSVTPEASRSGPTRKSQRR